ALGSGALEIAVVDLAVAVVVLVVADLGAGRLGGRAADRLAAVGAARVRALGPALALAGEALGPVALEAVVDAAVAVVVDVVAQLRRRQHCALARLPEACGVADALAFLADAA